MKNILYALIILIISGCSTTPRHIGVIQTTNKGDEYSIRDTQKGFVVAGHFSEYQFIRSSRKGFTGCMKVLNDAASKYGESKNQEIILPKWDEIEIVDHGRDLVTAIMHVNCKHEYKFIEEKQDIVEKIKELKSLYDTGALTKEEYELAKMKLLSN